MENLKPLAVGSLVLGIIAIVLCWVPILGLACGIVGLVLSVKAGGKARKANLTAWDGKGMNVGGLVCSIVGTVFSVIYNIIWIAALAVVSHADNIERMFDKM